MLRIFVAEDDADDLEFFRLAVANILSDAEIITFENGTELVDFLQRNIQIPDLIFVDINMPEMNGYETVEYIRYVLKLETVPVIILSTSKTEEEIEAMYKIGATFFVSKPNTFKDLISILQYIVSKFPLNVFNVRESFYLNNISLK